MEDKLKDAGKALAEEELSMVLSTDLITNAAKGLFSLITSETAASIVGALIGAAAPRVGNVLLSYKQKRLERNMIALLQSLEKRVDTLEANLRAVDEKMQDEIQNIWVEMLLDNVVDERQVEKVEYNVSGFVNLISPDANENIMQIFFDTLSQLTLLDIDTLRVYSYDTEMKREDLETKYGLDSDRIKLVKDKLVRLGLLSTVIDKRRDENLDLITEYLLKMQTELKKKQPKEVKIPTELKKIGRINLYKITPLGVSYLRTMGLER